MQVLIERRVSAKTREVTEIWGDPPPEEVTDPIVALEEERNQMEVSSFQAKAALHLSGLLEQAEAIVANSNNKVTQLAWTEARNFRRRSPTINALAKGMGLTSEQVDELFRLARTIEA